MNEPTSNLFTKWAFDYSTNNYIHINSAIPKNHTYICDGCKGRLIPCKGDIKEHYFRHNPKDVHLHNNKCKFGDETVLHKLAKEAIQIVGKIKLPGVKEPLVFDRCAIERFVYFDTKFNLRIEKSPPKEQVEYFKPDVVLYDNNYNPILFVEFVYSHEVDNEKLAKIHSFRINTVEIKIPAITSKEEINKIFTSSNYSKWLYHNDGLHIHSPKNSRNNSESVHGFNADEGEFFGYGESGKCRIVRIKNLIRGITKFMGTDEFNRVKGINSKRLEHIEGRTRTFKETRESMEERIQTELSEEFRNLERNSREKYESDKREWRKLEKDLSDKIQQIELEDERIERLSEKANDGIQRIEEGIHKEVGERYIEERTRIDGKKQRVTKLLEQLQARTGEIRFSFSNTQEELDSVKRKLDDVNEKKREAARDLRPEIANFKRTEEEVRRIRDIIGRFPSFLQERDRNAQSIYKFFADEADRIRNNRNSRK